MDSILYSTSAVLKECSISSRQLYYWELIGLITPRYENFGIRRFRRYTQQDLHFLREAKALLDDGFTLQAVKEKLTKLTGSRLPAATWNRQKKVA